MTTAACRARRGCASCAPSSRPAPPMRAHALPVLLCLACLGASASSAQHRLASPVAGQAVRLGDGWLSTGANDYNLSIDAGKRHLVFGRSSTGDFGDARVWVARRVGDAWTTPEPAAFSDGRWRDSDPWLTPDGRWLYFVSNRPAAGRDAGRDDLDLWRVPVTRTGFGAPEHLADASSPGEELGPEVHAGWLSFNSTRAGGPAALALYRARLVDGLPTQPEAMPAPFNDGRAQGDLTFSPDGRIALFWSIRGDSRDPDLFMARHDGARWSAATRLPAPFNAPGMDFTPAFSADGRTLRWASQRVQAGGAPTRDPRADLYAAAASDLPPAGD